MRYGKQIMTYGVLKTAVKQGNKPKPKNESKIQEMNNAKEICLNCPINGCTGSCKRWRESQGRD
jgi:hypothetical protein